MTAAEAEAAEAAVVWRGYLWRSLRRFGRDRFALLTFAVLAVVVCAGLLAGVAAPYSYHHFSIQFDQLSLHPTLRGGHLFGTDGVGHDIFSQTLFAIRTTVLVSLIVGVGATVIGVLVGTLAAYYQGWLDATLMRLADFVITVPAVGVLFAGIVVLNRQPRPHWVAEALILFLWPPVARVVRAAILELREREFLEAARALGASDLRLLTRHLLPSASAPTLVAATGVIGQAMLLEATAEFFGFGFDPWVTPSLGALIASGVGIQGLGNNVPPSTPAFASIFAGWWLWAFPAAVLVLVIVCLNFLGDSLDHALRPTAQR